MGWEGIGSTSGYQIMSQWTGNRRTGAKSKMLVMEGAE